MLALELVAGLCIDDTASASSFGTAQRSARKTLSISFLI